MICRVRRGVSGLSEYLLNGKKQNSKYLRLEKDVVRPLIGDFTLFQETEKYLVKEKNWKENYMHITIGFSDSDWAKIELLETCDEKNWKERESYYISFYKMKGYDLCNLTYGGEGTHGYNYPNELREIRRKARLGYKVKEETKKLA